ncbi:type II toxin-antitoxin system PemK/MazF family toxin [Luteococcus sanguinis]|uniref:Type II toxin-antitoxin system PemK/MazF family toxin n=1 Tax=Luteococcus sanguinis TaxID=174038 RepID=A0ABW1WYU0_9ACTN
MRGGDPIHSSVELATGEVWWASPDATVGREQSGRRPVLVVASQRYLDQVDTLALVVPLTTRDRGWSNHVLVTAEPALPEACFAMTEQLRAISRERLVSRLGRAFEPCMEAVQKWLVEYLVEDPDLLR